MFDKDYLEKCRRIARKNFENHRAYVRRYGEMTVIDWRLRTGSSNWAVRYILDGCRLIVTGDIGNAVFWRPEPFTLVFCRDLTGEEMYLAKKCIAGENDLYDHVGEYISKDLDAFADNIEAAKDDLYFVIKHGISCAEYGVTQEFLDTLSGEDIADLMDCGKEFSLHYIAWLVGLEMACRQIEEKTALRDRWTSDFCPKCGQSKYAWFTVVSYNSKPFGKWNYCPGCGTDLSGGDYDD